MADNSKRGNEATDCSCLVGFLLWKISYNQKMFNYSKI